MRDCPMEANKILEKNWKERNDSSRVIPNNTPLVVVDCLIILITSLAIEPA